MGAVRKVPDWQVQTTFPVEIETALRLDSKVGFGDLA